MKRYDKYDKMINGLRKEAETMGCEIARSSTFADNEFYVEFIKNYTTVVKKYVVVWNKKTLQFDFKDVVVPT